MFSNSKKDTKLYDILGVPVNADDRTIKKEYRKLAMKWHPDRNPNNEKAEKKFKEISAAYDILKDPEKKQRYDQFGIEGVKNMGGMANAEDIFENLFGGGSPFSGMGGMPGMGGMGDPFGMFGGNRNRKTRGPDVVKEIDVELEDFYNCTPLQIKLKKKSICPDCKGTGGMYESSVISCRNCEGKGRILKIRQIGPGMIQQSEEICNVCGGTGKIIKEGEKCRTCNGERIILSKVKYDIPLELGMKTGDKIVKEGEAHANPDVDIQGDLIFIIKEKPHDLFTRINNNLFYKKEINLVDALCGVSFDITHLDKRKLLIKSKDVIQPNSKMIVKNEGMPIRDGSYGDLIFDFSVKLPENLSDERKEYLQKLIKINTNNNYNESLYQVNYCERFDNDHFSNINLEEVDLDDEHEEPQIGCQTQ